MLAAFADAAERPRVTVLAVRDMPTSGKPAELLAAAGIDAEAIADAARALVGQPVGSRALRHVSSGHVRGLTPDMAHRAEGPPATPLGATARGLSPATRLGEPGGPACHHVGMAVLTATGLRKEFAGDLLFDDVSFKVERRDRVALAGPNGAGKTTLLRLIAGETSRDAGGLALAKGTRIALHDQRPPLERGLTLREYVLAGAADLVAIEDEPADWSWRWPRVRTTLPTLARYAEAQARLEHAGGYAWRDHATAVVRGLGFADRDLDRSLDTFSGGELTRASLARALGGDPDLLLLDEPTNHLDVASLEWLERELTSLDAAIILVAHDRWFLEAVTSATLELSAGRATYFRAPGTSGAVEKAERAAHAQKQADRITADIERLDRFVARFRYKKLKAKQAQAKLTQIGRLRRSAPPSGARSRCSPAAREASASTS